MIDKRIDTAAVVAATGIAAGFLTVLTGRKKLLAVTFSAIVGLGAMARRGRDESEELDQRASSMNEQIRQLEKAVATQVQSRMNAEQVVNSLSSQLRDAERRAGDTSTTQIVLGNNDSQTGGLTDNLTGLFNHEYFLVSLDSRIAAARRHLRPVSIAVIDVRIGREGDERPVADPNEVTVALRNTLRESDTATRLRDGRFGVVLEDTPENGAIWTMERLRRDLADSNPDLTMWAGVACYPAHAFDVTALIDRADKALEAAHDWQQDRIEVATTE